MLGDPNDLNSFSNKLRARRDVRLRALIEAIAAGREQTTILDIGGAIEYWHRVGVEFLRKHNVRVTLLNLAVWPDARLTGVEDVFTVEVGNGCNLEHYADGSFDLTHSNSVVEHLITWENAKAFAKEVRRVGRSYYQQTPNYWFPIDPHFYRVPMFHWLAMPLQAWLLTHFHVAYIGPMKTLDDAYQLLDETKLLDKTKFRYLFPDAEHTTERFALLPKSMIAIRQV